MNVIGYVIGFGILQAVLLAGLLIFIPRSHRLPNYFMAGLVLAISGAAPVITVLAAAYILYLSYRIATAPPLGRISGR